MLHIRRQSPTGLANISRQMWCASVLGAVILWLPGAVAALDAGQTKTAQGLTVYLGAMPAEIVRGHPTSHPEAGAHGGPPRGAHSYHLVVAIFEATTGARVSDAKVAARVASLGLAGVRKPLEPMRIAETITYGNYFDLSDKERYHITIEVEWPQGTVRFEFAYDH
jgi:hypothetical protein